MYGCEAMHPGWLWQGGSSRDTYIGTLFGLGSSLVMLQGWPAAAAELALAQAIFERVFDKLRADGFFLLPPPNCLPGNKEQCTLFPISTLSWVSVESFNSPAIFSPWIRLKWI